MLKLTLQVKTNIVHKKLSVNCQFSLSVNCLVSKIGVFLRKIERSSYSFQREAQG